MAQNESNETEDITVYSTEKALLAEHKLIWPGPGQPKNVEAYYASAQKNEQAALCLSGGGIRSAAFALGVLQALSAKTLLTQFHYLSSVSGGGYVNSWLQRWICEASRLPKDDETQAPPARADGAARVQEALKGEREPTEIKRLRENSNFITPRVGIASHDTWTAIAISVRNILVNWLLFLPLLMVAALLPNMFLEGVRAFPAHADTSPLVLRGFLIASAAAIAVAAMSTVRLLPSYRGRTRITEHAADRYLFWMIVFPLMVWAVLGTLALSVDLLVAPVTSKEIKFGALPAIGWFDGLDLALWSLGGMAGGVIFGGIFLVRRAHRWTFLRDWGVWPSSILVVSLWVALGCSLFNNFGYGTDPQAISTVILTVVGPLWLMTGTLLGASVFAAFRKSEGPTVKPDGDREWLARLSAVKIRPMLVWTLLGASVLLLNDLVGDFLDGGELTLSGLLTVVAGIGAIAGGRSEKTRGQLLQAKTFLSHFLPVEALVGLATIIFIGAMLFFIGHLEKTLASLLAEPIKPVLNRFVDPDYVSHEVAAHVMMLIVLAGLLLFFRRRIPVNRFSLNGLYRNRIGRAFLGAARPARDPDQFTGFDPADNIRMHLLRAETKPVPLYPVVNIALNVTATENLAWQERKAEPFIVSPLFTGSGMLDPEGVKPGTHSGAYISSSVYGGNELDLALGGTGGITLATAVSISGAAASPNMGYHSSPATAFLMTLFNVRLGAWLPNPARAATLKKDGLNRSSPDDSLRALLRELGGQTDDRGLDIYLSDGGHFENLALYEMVRRRCRYIVVSDAGADPECAFTDLGNAIRKVKIDLDVDIEFPPMRISKRTREVTDQSSWALGTITYPERGLTGRILYIKPSYFGIDLPVDVVAYAAEHEAFPHESTGDQFFSESQFESYRRLGEFLTRRIGGDRPWASLRAFFDGLAATPSAKSG